MGLLHATIKTFLCSFCSDAFDSSKYGQLHFNAVINADDDDDEEEAEKKHDEEMQ